MNFLQGLLFVAAVLAASALIDCSIAVWWMTGDHR